MLHLICAQSFVQPFQLLAVPPPGYRSWEIGLDFRSLHLWYHLYRIDPFARSGVFLYSSWHSAVAASSLPVGLHRIPYQPTATSPSPFSFESVSRSHADDPSSRQKCFARSQSIATRLQLNRLQTFSHDPWRRHGICVHRSCSRLLRACILQSTTTIK